MNTQLLELLQQEIEYTRNNNDFQGAFDCYTLVSNWLETKSGLSKNTKEYNQYYEYLVKLKFLSLNYFDDVKDYVDLVKNYFPLIFDIPYFDLWDKLETKLVAMPNVDERDDFKNKLRTALEKSDSILLNRQKYSVSDMPVRVEDWIKDFIVNLGLDAFDKVKKAEYISNSKFVKLLKSEDKEKIKQLLDIYEKLKLSSKTKEGYENSVVMIMDGKTVILNRGEVEEVQSLPKITMDSLISVTSSVTSSDNSLEINTSESFNVSREPVLSDLEQLQQALRNYPAGTLEHKAISQEISRLKVLELKAAQQKSNVKR